MRLLLDECVDQGLRYLFEGHECHSARYAGLAGLKNGALMPAAEEAGFEVMITTDQGIPHGGPRRNGGCRDAAKLLIVSFSVSDQGK